MLELGSRQNVTGMETERARGKCTANALVCQLCWTFLLLFVVGSLYVSKFHIWDQNWVCRPSPPMVFHRHRNRWPWI